MIYRSFFVAPLLPFDLKEVWIFVFRIEDFYPDFWLSSAAFN